MKVTKVNMDTVQWLVRSAYEEGYRAADGQRGKSKLNPKKGKWFDSWFFSNARSKLIQNGVISGEDDYR